MSIYRRIPSSWPNQALSWVTYPPSSTHPQFPMTMSSYSRIESSTKIETFITTLYEKEGHQSHVDIIGSLAHFIWSLPIIDGVTLNFSTYGSMNESHGDKNGHGENIRFHEENGTIVCKNDSGLYHHHHHRRRCRRHCRRHHLPQNGINGSLVTTCNAYKIDRSIPISVHIRALGTGTWARFWNDIQWQRWWWWMSSSIMRPVKSSSSSSSMVMIPEEGTSVFGIG